MARANRSGARFGSLPEDQSKAGSRGATANPRIGSFQLPTLGPSPARPVVTNPLLGYAYRDNETFAENYDRIEVIQRHLFFSLDGYQGIFANPSAVVANSAVYDITQNFLPMIYGFLHEMAQKRDGYKATTESLNTALNVPYRDSLLVGQKILIRVLAQCYTGALVNEGMKSLIPGFRSMRSRIVRDLEASNRFIYPAAWDALIDYWSQVYSPYPGGPLVINLFSLIPWIKVGAALEPSDGTATVWNALPDLTNPTDVAGLLNDVEVAQGILERYDLNVANTATDFRAINSIYAMMGFPTPQTGLPTIGVSPDKFHAQFMRYGLLYNDTKGVGADTHLFWPDIRGDADALINVNFNQFTPDILDFIGAKGAMGYAFDADDDDTPGYTAEANDLATYGLVIGNDHLSATGYMCCPPTKIYTRQGGWATLVRELDYTAASGVQAHIWSIPDITIHPESWRTIMSEEAEEAYRQDFQLDSHPVQIPFDHFGQTYRRWLYDAYKIPYVT